MVKIETIKAGLLKYLDAELITKIKGWRQLVTGAALGMYLENSAELFNVLKENPVIKSLGIVDENNLVDVEKLYKHFYAQAKKSAVTFTAPLVGTVTLNADDVNKIYEYIKIEE